MSMNNQTITLYRGIRISDIKKMSDPIGIHWSTSFEVALEFTKGNGIIVCAEIAEEDIVKFGTSEWEQYQYKYDMFEEGHRENEKTVRKGTCVYIKNVWDIKNGKAKKFAFNKTRCA